VKVYQSGGTGV